MEKIITLLNERVNSMLPWMFEYYYEYNSIHIKCLHPAIWGDSWVVQESRIISKEEWFILRLVTNKKVDILKISDRLFDKTSWFNNPEKVRTFEKLLMLLAIEDEPLKVLESVLE